MRFSVNTVLIKRRLRFSVFYFFLSTGLMGGGFLLTLDTPEDPGRYAVATATLLIGLSIWAVNQNYLTRWSPRSRQDATLHQALRGLDDRYYLYAVPAPRLPDYVLVGPMGVVVIVGRATAGTVTCDGERWRRVERTPFALRLLTWFSRTAPLGDPTREARRGTRDTARYLTQRLPPELAAAVPIEAIVVFSNPAVELTSQGCAVTALRIKSLRSHLRSMERPLRPDQAREVAAAIGPVPAHGRAGRREQ
jgi:hypothetical protein